MPKTKSPGVGLCCRRCGEPTRVYVTRRVDDFAVDRVRVCTAAGCGWRGRTVEVWAGTPAPPPPPPPSPSPPPPPGAFSWC